MRVERIFYSLVIATLIILLLLEKCKSPRDCPEENNTTSAISKTVETSDTTKEVNEFDTSYKPIPKNVYSTSMVIDLDSLPQGGGESIYLDNDMVDYGYKLYLELEKNKSKVLRSNYQDTIITPSGDSLIIRDTIENNLIAGRGINLKTNQVTVTNFRQTVIVPKQRNQFFFAMNVYGNKMQLINGFSGGIMLKTKKGKYYEAGSFISRGMQVTGYVGIKMPISFRKN